MPTKCLISKCGRLPDVTVGASVTSNVMFIHEKNLKQNIKTCPLNSGCTKFHMLWVYGAEK